MRGPFPPVAELVPHAPPMVLLTRVLEHSERHTACAVEIGPATPFLDSAGRVPAWIGIEYMGQCVAAHAGLRARARGAPVRIGFLVGSRRLTFSTEGFRVGQSLRVQAMHTWGQDESAAFACTIGDLGSDAILVEGTLNVFQPATLERFQPQS